MHAGGVTMKPLDNIQVLTLAVNLPGPVAAARLCRLGATVVKVEPPEGDPLAQVCPDWYRELHTGQEVLRLDLKDAQARARLEERWSRTDLLLTATRPAALARLGLSWEELHARHPPLCQVAIVGYPPPRENWPGHDLTYQARLGLLSPPHLPRALIADSAGAQAVVSAALALLLARERGQGGQHLTVSLAEAAREFAQPLRQGLTVPGGVLGGGLPGYNLYRAREGWLALAALEPHFRHRLAAELGLSTPGHEELTSVFLTRTASQWEAWGVERDLPIAALRDVSSFPESPP
jgi:crotonobetainyl-CoA:carnitine CoA-transferase CaiB-like acyl-CoA transferase